MYVYLIIFCLFMFGVTLYLWRDAFAPKDAEARYCRVHNMTIAYRIAQRRRTSVDPVLKRTLKSNLSEFKGINVCYSLKSIRTKAAPTGSKKENVVYAVGIILREDGSQVDAEERTKVIRLGYRVCTFPEMTYAVTACYDRSLIFPSHSTIQKAYVALERVMATRNLCGYPKIEIFNERGYQFIVPLTHQICYFVPELVPESPYEWYLNSVRPLDEQQEEGQ